MIDAKMEDFLARVESSQQYLIEVKMPSIKILEMVKKRLSYIREIKVGPINYRKSKPMTQSC